MNRRLHAGIGASFVLALVLGEASPAAQTPAADAALIGAAKAGELARVRELLASRAAVNATDRRGLTPLIWASASGNTEVVQQLLESGASVDQTANDGTTALMLASSNGFTDVVRALILRGANVAAQKGGVNARQLALERGHPDVVTLLEQAEVLGGRLLQAAAEGNDTVVRQQLALGAPANVTNERGATALMLAARNGDLGIMQVLLSRNANPYVRDREGMSVFDWAEPSSSTAPYVVAFLLDRGISRDAPSRAAQAQSPQVTASLRALASVLARVPSTPVPLRTAQQRATAALSRLQALSSKWPAESPDDYRDNLAGYVTGLETALKAGDVERLTTMIQTTAEDLEIKLEHCTRSGGRLGGSVVVRVRTVAGRD